MDQTDISEIENDPPLREFTAEEFLHELRMSNERWWQNDEKPGDWVFRGHRDASWPLLPAAHRAEKDGNWVWQIIRELQKIPVVGIYPSSNSFADSTEPDKIEKIINNPLIQRVAAEVSILGEFAYLANMIGLPVDLPMRESPLRQKQILSNIIDQRLPDPAYGNEGLMALAQHHGIPTRLLDWSTDPIIAAFFACDFPNANEGDSQTDIAVWAFRRSAKHEYQLGKGGAKIIYNDPIVFIEPPRFSNPYLKAQSGILSLVTLSNHFFWERSQWPTIENIVPAIMNAGPMDASRLNGPLHKIVLKADQVAKLRTILQREGYSRSMLMPTFDNVVFEIATKWRNLSHLAKTHLLDKDTKS